MTASQPGASATPDRDTADREIVITRLFDAPRTVVFSAFLDPAHIGKWWGPKGFTTTTHQMDVRPGGVWRHTMHGPDGTDYENENLYVEIAIPERLVYDHVSHPRHRTTITFDDDHGKTRLTLSMVFATAELRDWTVRTHGAIEGAKQMLERLEYELATAPPTYQPMLLTRILDAPRGLVFEAWTKPEHLQRWWGPERFTNPVCEFDARPGGAIRIHMRGPDGTIYPMTGAVQEVVPPERLVFVTTPLDANGEALFETVTTVTLQEQQGKTKLTVRVDVTKATRKATPYLAGMTVGWGQSLDRLQRFCGSM